MNMRIALQLLLIAATAAAMPAVAGHHGHGDHADAGSAPAGYADAASVDAGRVDTVRVDAGRSRGSVLRDRGTVNAYGDSASDSAGDSSRDGSRDGDRDGGTRERASDAPRVSMDEAVGRVLSAYGGRVIAASSVAGGRGMGYRIRVLQDDGRIHTVFVDARGGAMREMN